MARIAVDAMGGDFASRAPIAGALLALAALPQQHDIELVGQSAVIAPSETRLQIIKGLRAISDFEYEFEMQQLNRLQGPDIDTLYLMASPQYSFLSSSGIKELAMFGGTIEELVPERVAARLKEELGR